MVPLGVCQAGWALPATSAGGTATEAMQPGCGGRGKVVSATIHPHVVGVVPLGALGHEPGDPPQVVTANGGLPGPATSVVVVHGTGDRAVEKCQPVWRLLAPQATSSSTGCELR